MSRFLVAIPTILERIWDEKAERVSPKWELWVRQVTDQINRTAPLKPSAVTLGASPYVYQSLFAGDVRLLVSGGTVTSITFSRDNVTYFPTGIVSGMLTLSQGDFLKITYTVAPTITAVPA